MPGQWARGDGATPRRAELPRDWPRIRAHVLARDGHACRWIENNKRCGARATDVDHINNRHDHNEKNLRSLCVTHHSAYTSKQGNAERWKHSERCPKETHPGLRS